MASLRIVRANGDELDIQPDMESNVGKLRGVIGAALQVHPKNCLLFVDGVKELEDDTALADVCSGIESGLSVSVLEMPCQIKPEMYPAHVDDQTMSYKSRGTVKFPEPSDINVNMLPFRMGDMDSLPADLERYWPLIEACGLESQERGKVGYLTIHESHVKAGTTQRRPGIHIESPGTMKVGGEYFPAEQVCSWGWGDPERCEGGLYMASNTRHSCRIWNCRILKPQEAAGHLGDMEHFKEVIGKGNFMDEDRLYWLTDVTPHESLPVEGDTYRQFFRLVTHKLSVWYPEHSTHNPKCSPDPAITRVVEGSKFP
eukprot:TRINITY_DN37743_c0_g1_i2.p1 TRINITY_DN37743_c0_g1~~TRINITY_DN37743_c0_g1_i2.p1  ORF type:complete len:314 (+),score=38.75 TRINITY_DN37743_c0_g1_i2:94-1035(+)